jgi:hypothetical protein
MNAFNPFAFLIVSVCSVAGFAQSPHPTLTIGPHVLTTGMPESEVLDQLGADLILKAVQKGIGPGSELPTITPPESTWLVEKDLAGMIIVLGQVGFANHKLVSVSRNWDVKTTSARSLFSALDFASRNLDEEGFTNCKLATADGSYAVDKGSVSAQKIDLNCGTKGIIISLTISDAPNYISTSMHVWEWMHGD